MNVLINVVTASVALLGVLLGGWLSFRNQDRLWWRDHARQWRDVRLSTYNNFLTAYRQYVAFTLEPTANITAVPHPRLPEELMPFFDETGRPYKEKLEAAFTAVRLVSEFPDTVSTCIGVVICARQIAAARAHLSETDLPSEPFRELWLAEQAFLTTARQELGLQPMSRDPAREADIAQSITKWRERSPQNLDGKAGGGLRRTADLSAEPDDHA